MSRVVDTAFEVPTAPALTAADVSPEFMNECVEFFAEVVQVLGLQRSMGQIYGLLFASPVPLSFTDISEQLDISRGSASQGLQALRSLGAVRSVKSEEGRRELFEPELRLRALVRGVLREKVEPIVAGGADRLKIMRRHALNGPTQVGRIFSDERMRKLEGWRRQTGALLPVLRTVMNSMRRS